MRFGIKALIILAAIIVAAYLIARQIWIAQNCFGSINGTEICK